MKRIAVAGFQHETNTFASTLATYAEFEEADAWPGLIRGDEVHLKEIFIENLAVIGALQAGARYSAAGRKAHATQQITVDSSLRPDMGLAESLVVRNNLLRNMPDNALPG